MSLEEELIARVERSGLGCFRLAADLIDLAAHEADGWTWAANVHGLLCNSARALRKRQDEENATCPDVNTEHGKPTT